ncbi:COX15/CtaA family protein [Pleionea sediminis]|uniref:COX15/CtaA family protein n=1 Tax=Pleionea sediminis TaxID=2569479 RepID=UPI00118612A2|nr:COX15/CtaA family protein [Pleionea sediminis]
MNNKTQKRLTLIALSFVVVVIGLGAFTRLADAGLGCPDWPGCYGFVGIPLKSETIAKANQAFPEQPYELHKAWPEMVHRYFAGTLGLLVLGLFVLAFKKRGQRDACLKLSSALLVLIIFQAALGAWTVTEKLHPSVVMGHLLGGFATFSLLVMLAIRLYQPSLNVAPGIIRSKSLISLAIIAVVFQIALGGWTSANYAALACKDLPICFDGWTQYTNFSEGFQFWGHGAETYQYGVMSNEAKVAIHASHRIGAMIITALILTILWILFRRAQTRIVKQFAGLLTLTLAIQITLGVINVTFDLPLANAVAHNLVAAFLLISLVGLRTLIWVSENKKMESINV